MDFHREKAELLKAWSENDIYGISEINEGRLWIDAAPKVAFGYSFTVRYDFHVPFLINVTETSSKIECNASKQISIKKSIFFHMYVHISHWYRRKRNYTNMWNDVVNVICCFDIFRSIAVCVFSYILSLVWIIDSHFSQFASNCTFIIKVLWYQLTIPHIWSANASTYVFHLRSLHCIWHCYVYFPENEKHIVPTGDIDSIVLFIRSLTHCNWICGLHANDWFSIDFVV